MFKKNHLPPPFLILVLFLYVLINRWRDKDTFSQYPPPTTSPPPLLTHPQVRKAKHKDRTRERERGAWGGTQACGSFPGLTYIDTTTTSEQSEVSSGHKTLTLSLSMHQLQDVYIRMHLCPFVCPAFVHSIFEFPFSLLSFGASTASHQKESVFGENVRLFPQRLSRRSGKFWALPRKTFSKKCGLAGSVFHGTRRSRKKETGIFPRGCFFFSLSLHSAKWWKWNVILVRNRECNLPDLRKLWRLKVAKKINATFSAVIICPAKWNLR